MESEYLVVLDFEIGDVQIIPYDSSAYEDVEEFAEKLEDEMGISLNLSNSQYMVTKNLNIKII
jgi:hypothetical protein